MKKIETESVICPENGLYLFSLYLNSDIGCSLNCIIGSRSLQISRLSVFGRIFYGPGGGEI